MDFTGDIVILTNENTASASEVFTGVLKEYGLVKTVGTTTFGKGIVQTLVALNVKFNEEDYLGETIIADEYDDKYTTDDGVLKITESEWCMPSGENIHKKGLIPDYEVELNYDMYMDEGVDNQLDKAVEILLK